MLEVIRLLELDTSLIKAPERAMNRTELKMLDLLKRGRDQYGVVSVKAEFEAEGTRPDEFLRLLEMTHKAGLKVALKIGGCEAVTDLLNSKLYGVDYIIAPMVETPYALLKFIEAKDKTHNADEQSQTTFLFNLETETTLQSLDAMAAVGKGKVDGIVFGRVDFTLSRGLPRGDIDTRSITDAVLKVATVARDNDMELVVGGSVSTASIPALREIHAVRLDRFETRKVIFGGDALVKTDIEAGIENAVEFELAWLQNKRDYYTRIASEDSKRMDMIEKRLAAVAKKPKLV